MKCLICSSPSTFYFSKTYDKHFSDLMADVGEVNYWKCQDCGFVLSKTHAELDQPAWQKLNNDFHHHIENLTNSKIINQPPYAEQAMMLAMLSVNGVISTTSMLDYAGGYGTLGKLLEKYHRIRLPVYDPFVTADAEQNYIVKENLATYQTVINSAMFEHVLTREDLDQVNRLVDDDGALVLHTVICENIPKDPNWFYLTPPVHTAFHTNKSMGILMQQWGYSSSIYCPPSKCWVLLRNKSPEQTRRQCDSLNQELQSEWFHFKEGFLDYWKGF